MVFLPPKSMFKELMQQKQWSSMPGWAFRWRKEAICTAPGAQEKEGDAEATPALNFRQEKGKDKVVPPQVKSTNVSYIRVNERFVWATVCTSHPDISVWAPSGEAAC